MPPSILEGDGHRGGDERHMPELNGNGDVSGKQTTTTDPANTEVNDNRLKCFASHCYNFYHKSTSLHSSGSSSNSKGTRSEADDSDAEIAVCVVRALDESCHSSQDSRSVPECKKQLQALKECGLDRSLSAEQQMEYSSIRTRQRSLVHEEQMEERKRIFWMVIADRQQQDLKSKNTSDKPLREVEMSIAAFCRKYAKVIGTHSLMAGLRTVLERQISAAIRTNSIGCGQYSEHEAGCTSRRNSTDSSSDCASSLNGTSAPSPPQHCVSWTFDIGTVTEHCYAHQGSEYMTEAINVLSNVLFVESNTSSPSARKSEITWHVKPHWSNRSLKRFLYRLPPLKSLDAKATGTIEYGNIERNIGDNEYAEEAHHGIGREMCEMMARLGNCFRWTK
jgi:hypothetical protein